MRPHCPTKNENHEEEAYNVAVNTYTTTDISRGVYNMHKERYFKNMVNFNEYTGDYIKHHNNTAAIYGHNKISV